MKAKMKFFAKAAATRGELYLYDEIGDGFFGGISPSMVADALNELKGCKTLDVYVNSPGGNVFDGKAIYAQIKRFDARKIVHVDGLAASIASVICMAGDEIRMSKGAEMMIHQPFVVSAGTAEDFRKTADLLDQIEDTLVTTYCDRTKNDAAQVKAWMADETWMNADVAKERGFCDAIEEDASVTDIAASPILAKYKHTPESLLKPSRSAPVAISRMEAYLLRRKERAA